MSNDILESTMTGSPSDEEEADNRFDWQKFIFEPTEEWIDRLTRLAMKRLRNRTLAEEAFNFAFERISEDKWRRLSNYSGKSTPGTFLISVFNNALEDFSRTRFGRPRPPLWLARLGESWKCVFRMLCLERMEPETIVDWLCARADRDPDQIRKIIAVVRSRICNCGQMQGDFATAEVSACSGKQQISMDTPDSILEEQELASLLGALAALLNGDGTSNLSGGPSNERFIAFSARIQLRWSGLVNSLEMTDQEQLILRQVYQDGRKVAVVSRALGLPEHKVRRTCERVVSRLRNALKKSGIDADSLKNLADE